MRQAVRDRGGPSQPTLSRLENAVGARECYRMALVLLELYVGQRGKDGKDGKDGGAPKRVLLDFGATDNPTHGEQEGSYYHGYYRQHMYHPLVVLDGETGQLVTVVLRCGNTHASRGAVGVLKRIVGRLRRAWGKNLEIEIRADAGFAVPDLYDYCEKEGISYAIGLITNPRLVALAESENRIKDFKVALKADRLSCCRFLAHQFRLILHAVAYWLLDVLRKRLVRAGVKRMQLDTLRLWLIKVGGCARQLLTVVNLHLASGQPVSACGRYSPKDGRRCLHE